VQLEEVSVSCPEKAAVQRAALRPGRQSTDGRDRARPSGASREDGSARCA
jgi:hypothetical protein